MIKMLTGLLLLPLMASAAFAETPTVPAMLDRGDTGTCQPSSFGGSRTAGMAAFDFFVTADGIAREVKTLRSSGDPAADAAARKCVESQRYKPTTRYDEPDEEVWAANVSWSAAAAPALLVKKAPAGCSDYYPPEAIAAGAQGTTKFFFRALRKSMAGIELKQSSGNADLDEGAILCVSKEPLLLATMKKDATWNVTVVWDLRPSTQIPGLPGSTAVNFFQNTIDMHLSPADPAKKSANVPCWARYPEAARKKHAEGTATVHVHTTPERKKEDARIEKTTGDPDLDAASLQCAIESDMGLEPGDHSLYFLWKLDDPLIPAEAFKPCASFGAVTASMVRGIPGITTVAFQLMSDGSVDRVRALRSSGDRDLDGAAKRCIQAHRYDTSKWKLPVEGMTEYQKVDWRKELATAE